MDLVAQIVLPLFVTVACLYLWASICFLFFRYTGAETEPRLREFLRRHHGVYTYSFFSDSPSAVTAQVMKKAGSQGWWAAVMAVMVLGDGFSYLTLLLSNAVLFFGGLRFAYAWYGVRCLRLLGLDSYANQNP